MRILAVLTVLIALPASAGPQPECKTAYGKTACGYTCEAAYGEVACAQTAWGTCTAAYGKLVCGDGARHLIDRPSAPPKVECEAAYGDIACGWSCTAAYGKVRCAQTPEGRCQATNGDVTCWDPPARPIAQPVVVVGPGGQAIAPVVVVAPQTAVPRRSDASTWPPATCESAYGKTACGYHCKAAYGDVVCAQTPFGTCEAAYGKVTCWDPPR